MGLLERWDRRNQKVLEEHNRRPAPTGAEAMAALAVFAVGNAAFRIAFAAFGGGGWLSWAAGAVASATVAFLAATLLRRRGTVGRGSKARGRRSNRADPGEVS